MTEFYLYIVITAGSDAFEPQASLNAMGLRKEGSVTLIIFLGALSEHGRKIKCAWHQGILLLTREPALG